MNGVTIFVAILILFFSLGDIFNLNNLDKFLYIFNGNERQEQSIDMIRLDVKKILEQDLIAWEDKWKAYTPREAFSRFVADKPPAVQQVFWDEFEYMESKVNAGRSAYFEAIQYGYTKEQARHAYYSAAETHRDDLIELNTQYNINHGLANAKEQNLFINGKYMYRTP